MKRTFILVLLAIIFCQKSFAQNDLKKDTLKVNQYILEGKKYVQSNTDSAKLFFYKGLKIAKRSNFTKGIAEIYLNLGYLNYETNKLDSSVYFYKKSLLLYESIENKIGIAKVYNNWANTAYSQGNSFQAIDLYNKSLEIRKKLNDNNGVAECYNNMGIISEEQANYTKALEFYQKSLVLREKTENKQGQSDCFTNIGSIHYVLNDYNKALYYFEKALAIDMEMENTNSLLSTYINIGLVHNSKNDLEKSISYFEKALNLSKQINNKIYLAFSLHNMGIAYESKDSLAKALEYYQQALANFETLDMQYEIATSYGNMANVYFKQNKYELVHQNATKALLISSQIDAKDNIQLAYKILYDNYKQLGNYKEALDSYQKYRELNDSIYNIENAKKITQMEMQYDFDKEKQKTELEHAVKIERQRYVTYSFIFGFIFMLLFSIVVFRNYRQKRRDNILLEKQKSEILEKNVQITTHLDLITNQQKQITDSINYAQRIQESLLPSIDILKKYYPECFVLFRPCHVVSGDYYWFKQINNYIVTVAADCTGHGVPGAFMSVLGISLLNEIIDEQNVNQPNEILNELRKRVKNSLQQTGKIGEQQDGMDIAICVLDIETNKLYYSGAYNSLYLIRKTEANVPKLIEFKADRMPIGIHPKDYKEFAKNEIQLQTNDTIYIFSDGYTSQFGGIQNENYKTKRFKENLLAINDKNLSEQHHILSQNLDQWQSDEPQTDDIVIIGLKINKH